MEDVLSAPEGFDPALYDVRWDAAHDDYSVRRLSDGCIFSVTAHSLAVLRDAEYRNAVFAVQTFIRSMLH